MGGLTREKALWIYETMLRIRRFEERAIEVFQAGELPGFIHPYIGEEAVAAGVCAHLGERDLITSTHRGHGHMIAKGLGFKGMMAELYARSTGCCKGKGGSLHIADQDLGALGASGIVGGGIPIAAGAALGLKLKKRKEVAVSFFGDGATNIGAFHEGINLAATWRLPAVFVCENNGYAQSTPQAVHQSVRDVAERAKAYGIPGIVVDGMDALAVHETAGEAIRRARAGEGPSLIEAKTFRFWGHYLGDPGTVYGHDRELPKWKKRDPIPAFAAFLKKRKWLAGREDEALDARVRKELDEAVEFARKSPPPEPSDLMADVYEKVL
ncbi:MAG: thiamine pyrophosphate-dependent dehydrogenase E1 component subunit alpha [Candidatus Tectomicrobia bacterium]|uniref:Thiamine pyrophosphate-dependent dehydrogenase E1 component subunit alpha n=1 Tax=Tectimicrobiota bacterium TaxID=2528274 RepID=A0A932HX39_UNCTE|nr:thiamine pyrophosphate-dependent dehydrogenase E1 component subunit alpha [Candidatus Tectomicrobia bacterium]